MRVTGGHLKGLNIQTQFSGHVRPTTDKVREAIFNKLEHVYGIEGAVVLDLFAGSGIMALEFLSRNAAAVLSVDKDTRNLRNMAEIRTAHQLDNWDIEKADVFTFLQTKNERFDIIFADPPYDLPGIQNLVTAVKEHLHDHGWFILEHRPGLIFHDNITESKAYGSSAITIFAKY